MLTNVEALLSIQFCTVMSVMIRFGKISFLYFRWIPPIHKVIHIILSTKQFYCPNSVSYYCSCRHIRVNRTRYGTLAVGPVSVRAAVGVLDSGRWEERIGFTIWCVYFCPVWTTFLPEFLLRFVCVAFFLKLFGSSWCVGEEVIF